MTTDPGTVSGDATATVALVASAEAVHAPDEARARRILRGRRDDEDVVAMLSVLS